MGVTRLERRVGQVMELRADGVRHNDPKVAACEGAIRRAILDTFGKGSPEHQEHQYLTIWHGSMNVGDTDEDSQSAFEQGIDHVVELLRGMTDYLREQVGELQPGPERGATTATPSVAEDGRRGRKVFVVHGHNEEVKSKVARLVETLELEAIILHEQPDKGRTIIEKFEEESDVAFAIVLFTADDPGYPQERADDIKPRARQNVVLELGFFLGVLGRDRVCVLYEDGVEMPSDYQGVLYKPIDAGGAWRYELAKEIRAAGLEVDLNLL